MIKLFDRPAPAPRLMQSEIRDMVHATTPATVPQTIIGYARVSTVDQDLEVQLEALASAGAGRVFSEKRSGSSTRDRTELQRCLEWVREGDVLVVTRLDRLARSVKDLHDILEMLAAKGVGFRCLQQPVDTTSSIGKLTLSILGAFAEFENDIRRERQREGIKRARAAGVYVRQPTVTKAQILALREAHGWGAARIGKELGVHKRTIYRNCPEGWGAPIVNGGADVGREVVGA